MKVVPKKHPAEFVEPNLPEARERRLWNRIDARLHQPQRSRLVWTAPALASVALFAAALFLILHGRATAPVVPVVAPEVVASGDTDQILDFANGSSIALHPHTQLVMLAVSEENVRLRLERGGVACHVRAGSKGAFTVEAGNTTATLGPGHYEVHKDGPQAVRVATQAGQATVHAADGSVVATLNAGEHWSEIEASRVAGWVSVPASAPSPLVSSVPSAAPKPEVTKVEAPDASQIFARGEHARLEGKSDEAARAFDELYHAFPGDARAPIAALEAGRLHLNGNGNLKEAVSALTFARANAREPFREDAHAGLVEALARAGQVGACQAARDDFLTAYPASPHREKVAARCP